MNIRALDLKLIHFFQKISVPVARIGLFVVFFWFGFLKILGLSPAGPLVHALYLQTIPFIPFDYFYISFSLFECIIGILFLIKGAERIVLPLLLFHMTTTVLPLIFVPNATWQSFMVPTLEGQYIIKNLALIATAIGIASHLRPIGKK
jgi:uncharacterized membrane protein YkgB